MHVYNITCEKLQYTYVTQHEYYNVVTMQLVSKWENAYYRFPQADLDNLFTMLSDLAKDKLMTSKKPFAGDKL